MKIGDKLRIRTDGRNKNNIECFNIAHLIDQAWNKIELLVNGVYMQLQLTELIDLRKFNLIN